MGYQGGWDIKANNICFEYIIKVQRTLSHKGLRCTAIET